MYRGGRGEGMYTQTVAHAGAVKAKREGGLDLPEYCQALTVYAHAVLSTSLVVLQRMARYVSAAVHDPAVQTEPGTLLGATHYTR